MYHIKWLWSRLLRTFTSWLGESALFLLNASSLFNLLCKTASDLTSENSIREKGTMQLIWDGADFQEWAPLWMCYSLLSLCNYCATMEEQSKEDELIHWFNGCYCIKWLWSQLFFLKESSSPLNVLQPIELRVSFLHSQISICWSRSLGLFCQVSLERDPWDWDWRLSLKDTSNTRCCILVNYRAEFQEVYQCWIC